MRYSALVYVERRDTECVISVIMLSVILLNGVIRSVIMLRAIALSQQVYFATVRIKRINITTFTRGPSVIKIFTSIIYKC